MNTELLRLFNAVYVTSKEEQVFNRPLFERGIKNGYVLSPFIKATPSMLDTIESVVGISGEKANAAFHKSWSVVRDASIEQLVIQQIIHYITTYGFERLGIFSNDTVYIPREELNLPAVKSDIPLTVIKAMDAAEILVNILVLAGSGIALSKETLADIMTVIKGMGFAPDFIEEVKNRELKAALYDFYNLAPSEPVEYLRYVVTKMTGDTLLIKNACLIGKIKQSDAKVLDSLLGLAPANLASIFLRFKPLFLAMKSISKNKTFFNQLRKAANKLHQPMPEDYLNSVTAKITAGTLKAGDLKNKLASASIFRKIRLAYALQNRLNAGKSTVYKVRNGRGWATGFEWSGDKSVTTYALDIVVSAIAKDMSENVSGKTIYIPANVHYALPATEKQFSGNVPANTYVSVANDLLVGVHWFDVDDEHKGDRGWYGYDGRVDLDLSLLSLESKYGWDGWYRSNSRDILFSGDVTSAPKPNGASEFFYIKNLTEAKLLMVNYFNFRDEGIECKFIIASEKPSNLSHNYVVDVNNIVASANVKLTKNQNVLAMIMGVDGESRVYFTNTSIGNSISSRNNDVTKMVNEHMKSTCLNTIELAYVLEMAGAVIVAERPVEGEYLDLSPEVLDKTTIIKLLLPLDVNAANNILKRAGHALWGESTAVRLRLPQEAPPL